MDKIELIEIVKERYQVPEETAQFLAFVLFAGETFENEGQVIGYLQKLEALGEHIKL